MQRKINKKLIDKITAADNEIMLMQYRIQDSNSVGVEDVESSRKLG
ncbi:MAG: hypothetical protein ACYCS0_05485 [bacterium]|jgi:hypothetical protein